MASCRSAPVSPGTWTASPRCVPPPTAGLDGFSCPTGPISLRQYGGSAAAIRYRRRSRGRWDCHTPCPGIGFGRLPAAPVTADVKMGEIAEVELTHHRIVASSVDTVRRCFRQIAEGGRSERNIRDERSGSFHPWDRLRTGHRPEHGAPVSEIAGDHQGQAPTTASIQAGPIHPLHRQSPPRGVGELRGTAPGAEGPGL